MTTSDRARELLKQLGGCDDEHDIDFVEYALAAQANEIWEEAAKLFDAKASEALAEDELTVAGTYNSAAYMCRARKSSEPTT